MQNHSMLAENLAAVSNINKKLAKEIEEYIKSNEKYESPKELSLEDQKKQLVYLSSGHLTHNFKPIDYESENFGAFENIFDTEEIASDRFDACFNDIHEDLHYAYFHRQIKKEIENNEIKLYVNPVTRHKPTFLILLGLAGREKIDELIEYIQPLHVLLIETDVPYLVDFLKGNSLAKLQSTCSGLDKPCTFAISIGCGDPNDVTNEIQRWTAKNSSLGMEGLLISEVSYPSIKREVVRNFLSQTTWHIDAVQRMGYQVDEYNMLYNTARNFDAQNNKVFRPLPEDYKNNSVPVVITGSGPSLDDSIETIKANRNRFILVSGGSSISTLLEAGIKPDIHVQLERSNHQYTLHKELAEKHDLSDILLICSSTVPVGLQSLFKKSIYFFRPALSPLAVYAVTPNEIHTAEGPDTVNSAVSSVLRLGFNNIALFGVDCGSASKKSIRSAGAFGGYIPRKLQKVERGASGRTIFTNSRLQTVRDSIDVAIRLHKKSTCINYSDGLNIPNAKFSKLEGFAKFLVENNSEINQKSIVEDIWNNASELNHHRVYTSWSVADPRQKCFNFFRRLETFIEETDDIRELVSKISDHISITKQRQTKADQLIPRITRGTFGKICPLILNIYYSNKHQSNEEVLDVIRNTLKDFIDLLETDVYSVIDKIEPSSEAKYE